MIMKSFLTALQFLTRIHIKNQDLAVEDYGRSTKFFPLVGTVLGIIYTAIGWLLIETLDHIALVTTLMLLMPVLFTGGLLLDGFMDTVDGVFSGRSRERQLEIMKDSRVGSFGVIALLFLTLLNWSILHDIATQFILPALFLMPIIGRMAMVLVIASFPYARKEGMGKIFAAMADKNTVCIAVIITLLCVLPFGYAGIAALAAGLVFAYILGSWLTKKLGGLTGDTYGAIETLTETIVLLVFFILPFIF